MSSFKSFLPAVMAGIAAMAAAEFFLLPSGELGLFAAYAAALIAGMAMLLAAFAAEVPVIGRHLLGFSVGVASAATAVFFGLSFSTLV